MLKFAASYLIAFLTASSAYAEGLAAFEDIQLPVGADAREPYLYATHDGRLLMSWTEVSANAFAVRVAAMTNGIWSAPRTIVASPDLFVNWADFPSISEFADGTLIAHWLQSSGPSAYAYDVLIALSRDSGETWSAPILPHQDRTQAQHGFVTLFPRGEDVIAVWLDGRAYDAPFVEDGATSGQMQLRSAVISSDGSVTPDIVVDYTTCSCCQTAAAVSEDALLVVYRDRNEDEVRDISLTKLHDGIWSAPMSVHEDNWELSGCPVNGPSIAASGDRVVVAWFTGAGDLPAVNVAFSNNSGTVFDDPIRIDRGEPIGRIDALMLEDGTALVSWIEWQGSDEILLVCQATDEGCNNSRTLAINSAGNSMNFPQMAATSEGIYIAWTQPLPGGRDTIRMMRSAR